MTTDWQKRANDLYHHLADVSPHDFVVATAAYQQGVDDALESERSTVLHELNEGVKVSIQRGIDLSQPGNGGTCECEEFKVGDSILTGFTQFSMIHGMGDYGTRGGPLWRFCAWCGEPLAPRIGA